MSSMKLIFLMVVLFLPVAGWGQTLGNGKVIDKDSMIRYIIVHVSNDSKTEMSGKNVQLRYFASVDYGQDMSYDKSTMNDPNRQNQIPGAENGMRIFHSLAEIFNFFAGYGWEYVELMPRSQYALYDSYLFKRKD